MTESRIHIQAPQTSEARIPRCLDKNSIIADLKLNPNPATKLTEQLVAETVHGHAPIHGRSVNPGLTVDLLEDRRLLVTAAPIGALSKGELKGEILIFFQREEVTRQTGLVVPSYLSFTVPNDPAPTTKPSNKTMEEAK